MHRILSARARLHDAEQMKALLAPIKHGDELGADLSDGEQGSVELYDRETKTFRYIVSDGRSVACYTVTGTPSYRLLPSPLPVTGSLYSISNRSRRRLRWQSG